MMLHLPAHTHTNGKSIKMTVPNTGAHLQKKERNERQNVHIHTFSAKVLLHLRNIQQIYINIINN